MATPGTTRDRRSPYPDDGYPYAGDHRPAGTSHDDVHHARAGMRNAGVTFGPRARRTAGDSWRDFVDRYGWRAWALPALVVITVAALLTATNQVTRSGAPGNARAAAPQHKAAPPPTAPASIPLKEDATGGSARETALKAAALPPGAAYTVRGNGDFRVLKGSTAKVGSGRLYRYSIEVENGISGVDLTDFATTVDKTLDDPRSWSGHGVALKRVDSGPVDFRVSLTSAMTVRKLCGYSIPVETSCYAQAGGKSPVNRVVFNVARWVRGATAYVGDLAMYRVYMINHEDGHALGHNHAHQCLPGGLAPAMMQQTFGLRSAKTGKFCQANPWPYPVDSAGTVVSGAPGAEQLDTAGNDEYGHGD